MRWQDLPVKRVDLYEYFGSLEDFTHITFYPPFNQAHGEWIRDFLQCIKYKTRPVRICITRGDNVIEVTRTITNCSDFF